MLRGVIYTRVSTEDQIANFSLEGQEKSCREYAKRNDTRIIKVFREEGASAKTIKGRPQLLELIKYCKDKNNRVSVVLVYKLDRWSRNTAEGLAVMGVLSRYGINVVSTTEPSEDNAIGKAMRGMILVWAEMDNDIRSERTISGMKTALENGHWPWQAPIGYRHKVINEKKSVELQEGFRSVLNDLFTDAGTGIYTKDELSISMNKAGFEQLYGKPATHKMVEKILLNRFYYGGMYAKRWTREYSGKHEPVIDKDTWVKSYNVMFQRSNSKVNTDEKFPLRRFVLCKSCNKPFTGSISRGNGGKYSYYSCGSKLCSKPLRVARDKLNSMFVDYLNKFTLNETQRKLLNTILLEKAEKEVLRNKQHIKQLNNYLIDIEKEKRTTIKANAKGLLDDKETLQIVDDLRNNELVYKLQISEHSIDKNEMEQVIDFATNFLSNVGQLWEKLDYPKKRALQSAMFPEKVYYLDGKIGTTQLAHSFKLISAIQQGKVDQAGPRGIEPRLPP